MIKYFKPLFILILFIILGNLRAQNCNFNITVPQDITICSPDDVLLAGDLTGNYVGFEWSGTDGYFDDINLTPLVFIANTTTYKLKAFSLPTTNLIINGDFEAGASGFTTDYTLSFPGYTCPSGNHIFGLLGCEGVYYVGPSSGSTHIAFANCFDHTGGGNMMMVNGAASLQQVWCQNVAVMPNKRYIFQAFGTSIASSSPAILQFSINGALIGSSFSLSNVTCNWEEFFTTWESGASTNVQICITNQNTSTGGNDFAIDDLFFGPLCEDEKEFTVTVSNYDLQGNEPAILDCNNTSTELNIIPLPDIGPHSYQWTTTDGTFGGDTDDKEVTVTSPGSYEVEVTDINNCKRFYNFEVAANFVFPEITLTGDTLLDCSQKSITLTGLSNLPVEFSTWTLPDNTTITDELMIQATEPGEYELSITAVNGCISTKKIRITQNQPSFDYQIDSTGAFTCSNDSVRVFLDIDAVIDSIVWQGPSILMKDTLGIIAGTSGIYTFTMFTGVDCFFIDSIALIRIPTISNYKLPPLDTLTCNKPTTNIGLIDTQNIKSIQWLKNGVPVSNDSEVVIDTAGIYQIQITDTNGCITNDNILIAENKAKPTYQVSTDTIDCVTFLGGFTLATASSNTVLWQGSTVTSTAWNPVFDTEGNYTVIVIAPNGCNDTTDYYLPASIDLPKINVTIDTITCNNPIGTINIITSIPTKITWESNNSQSGTSNIITSTTAQTYTITAVSDALCQDTKTVTIGIDTIKPNLSFIVTDSITCNQPDISPSFSASGYSSFLWSSTNYSNSSELKPSWTTPGLYTLNLIGANGCGRQQIVNVKAFLDPPNISYVVKDIDCTNPTTDLKISGDSNVMLALNNQAITANSTIDKAGTYELIGTNEYGCVTTQRFTIRGFFEKPLLSLDIPILTCKNPIAILKNKLTNSIQTTYVWNYKGKSTGEDSLLVNTADTIKLAAKNKYGCTEVLTITSLENKKKPEAKIIGNPVIPCNDDNVKLVSSILPQNYNITWKKPETTTEKGSEITATQLGKYTLTVIDEVNGCIGTDSLIVSKQLGPTLIDYEVAQPLCPGDLALLTIKNIVGGIAPYAITNGSNPIQLNNSLALKPDNLAIRAVDKNGCEISDVLPYILPTDYTIDAGDDAKIKLFESYPIIASAILNGNQIDNISWSPSNNLSCNDCLNPIATPEQTTLYTITTTSQNGCIQTDQIELRVVFTKGYVAPNIIAFNSTSGNGKFTIYSKDNSIVLIKNLKIYDRWGNWVFTNENFLPSQVDLGWDGSYRGRDLVLGVYIWVADIIYKDGTNEIIKGDVTVIR